MLATRRCDLRDMERGIFIWIEVYLFIYLKSYVVENQPTNLFKLIHHFCIQRVDVSFLFVCPLVDDKLRHDIVKLPMEPQAGGRVVPQ